MTEPASTNGDNSRGKEVRKTLVHLLLLVAVGFLVWQLAVLLKGSDDAKPHLGRLDPAMGDGGEPQSQPVNPAVLRDVPGSAAGLEMLKSDPLGIAPPKGAKRTWASRRRVADRFEDFAQYSFTGEPSVVVEHYKTAFRENGFDLLSETGSDADMKRLVFKRELTDATVSLRKKAAEGKIIGISVLVTHPAAD